jgi:hypothetical protein
MAFKLSEGCDLDKQCGDLLKVFSFCKSYGHFAPWILYQASYFSPTALMQSPW